MANALPCSSVVVCVIVAAVLLAVIHTQRVAQAASA